MAAYVCPTCTIKYPPAERNRLAGKCIQCGESLEYFTNVKWDKDWREKSGAENEEPIPWGPHPDEDACTVIYDNRHDTLHVLDRDLRSLGYLPVDGDVVKLNGRYYELLGFSLRGRLWWLEQFSFEPTQRQIKRAAVWKGPSSDDIVALDSDEGALYFDPREQGEEELQ